MGPFRIFKHLLSQKNSKFEDGGQFRKKMFLGKKSRNAENKLKRGPFSFARYYMLRGKKGKNVDQMVQFDTINFVKLL